MNAPGPPPLDAAAEGASLAPLLALIEKHGDVVLPSRDVEKLLPIGVRAALHAAGVLARAEPIASWPCEVRGCGREIRANHAGARKPLVAVCFQVPAACGPVELGFDDVSQQRITVAPLLRAACGLLGAAVDDAALAATAKRHPIGLGPLPPLVATSLRGSRDLFWVAAPRDVDLAAFCARRERVKRRTLVFVPTGAHVSLDLAARYAAGEQVEVLALGDLLEISGGVIALRGGGEAGARPAAAPPFGAPRAAGLAATLEVTRWEDVRMLVLDGHTLRIEAGGHTVLRTFVELGFVDGRKKGELAPVIGWSVLVLLCQKGALRPSEYREFGKPWAVKKGMEEVRRRLREAFGLEGDPLLPYLSKHGWRPRFRVRVEGG